MKSRMIYVVGHVTQGFGAVQALQNHLAREAMTFCVIEHPLFVERAWTTAAYHSTYRRYVKGREVAQRRGPCVLRPQALRYLKDVLYTVWCGFREPECIDLFIGINNLNALSGLCLKWLGRVRRVVFYTVDYARTARFATPALNAIYRWVDRLGVWGADEVWNVSDRIRHERQRIARDPRKLRLVPNTVDLAQIPDVAQAVRVPGRLIFVGGLMRESGLDEVIEALPAIQRQIPSVTLTIIGGGPSEAALRELVTAHGLQSMVCFLGYRPYGEALHEIAQACVGLSPYAPTAPEAPYLYYCDPSKVKAYLACGCPIVIYDLPEVARTVAQAGAGIVYRTRDALVAAIVALLRDERVLAQYRANALQLAAQFDQTRVFQRALASVAA